MLEIEIKAYADSHARIKKKIVELGGSFFRSVHEEDVYFNHPSRDFGATDEALRIRVEESGAILTYKGPKLSGLTKTRFEKETRIEDAEAAYEILERLGFVKVETVIKQRDMYLYRDIEVCIDSVEGVGDFIELEKRGENREEAEQELFALAALLGLDRFERRSYLELKLGKK